MGTRQSTFPNRTSPSVPAAVRSARLENDRLLITAARLTIPASSASSTVHLLRSFSTSTCLSDGSFDCRRVARGFDPFGDNPGSSGRTGRRCRRSSASRHRSPSNSRSELHRWWSGTVGIGRFHIDNGQIFCRGFPVVASRISESGSPITGGTFTKSDRNPSSGRLDCDSDVILRGTLRGRLSRHRKTYRVAHLAIGRVSPGPAPPRYPSRKPSRQSEHKSS